MELLPSKTFNLHLHCIGTQKNVLKRDRTNKFADIPYFYRFSMHKMDQKLCQKCTPNSGLKVAGQFFSLAPLASFATFTLKATFTMAMVMTFILHHLFILVFLQMLPPYCDCIQTVGAYW